MFDKPFSARRRRGKRRRRKRKKRRTRKKRRKGKERRKRKKRRKGKKRRKRKKRSKTNKRRKRKKRRRKRSRTHFCWFGEPTPFDINKSNNWIKPSKCCRVDKEDRIQKRFDCRVHQVEEVEISWRTGELSNCHSSPRCLRCCFFSWSWVGQLKHFFQGRLLLVLGEGTRISQEFWING